MRTASTAFASAITESHQLAVQVDLLDDGEDVATVTEVVEGQVTLDATAQTRGRLEVTIVDDGTLGLIPDDPTDDFAPYGNELRVSRGITFPDATTEVVSLGVFRIDDVNVSDTAQGMLLQISGLDRSARLIDARFEEPFEVAQGTNYTTAIRNVLEQGWAEMEMDLAETSRTTPQLTAEEGGDRWAFATEMATSLGMVLYFDGDGVCVMRPQGAVSTSAVLTLAEGAGGVLVEAGFRWTREGTYNRVIATGENTGETAPSRGVATDDNPASPTYYYGPFGRVPRFYVSQFITSDDQAQDAAAAILSRELGTTRQVNFGAVVDPRLEPEDVVRITRARAGIDEDHVVDQVTIPLSATGVMTGRTRAVQVS